MISYSIIKKSQLEGARRLDAEYYQPEFLEIKRKINTHPSKTIKEMVDKVFSGPFGSTLKSESYRSSGIPFIRIGDIIDVFVSKENLVYISMEENERIFSTHLDVGDIVLSKIATIGRLSVITEELGQVNISENNIGICLSKLDNSEKVFLLFFLLSKYGQAQILQKTSGNIQLKLNVTDVESIKVPVIEKKAEKYIEGLFKEAEKLHQNSKLFYSQAEELLLNELGLKDFKTEKKLSCVVSFSDIKEAKRIDADYFQSEVNQILGVASKHNLVPLDDLLVDMKKGIEVGAEAYQDEGKLFMRVSSISKDGVIDKDQKYLDDELYKNLKEDYEPQVGEILLTKDATPGIACVVREQISGIVSGGVVRLAVKKDIEPEYLALCINSIIGSSQVKRGAGGSIIAHWKPEQIKNLQIPVLSKSVQQKISDLVKKSHESRKKAKELLEEAKNKVEELINRN